MLLLWVSWHSEWWNNTLPIYWSAGFEILLMFLITKYFILHMRLNLFWGYFFLVQFQGFDGRGNENSNLQLCPHNACDVKGSFVWSPQCNPSMMLGSGYFIFLREAFILCECIYFIHSTKCTNEFNDNNINNGS